MSSSLTEAMEHKVLKNLVDLGLAASLLTAAYFGCNLKSKPTAPHAPSATPTIQYVAPQKQKLAFDTYIVDPGHGGSDYGATQFIGLPEKDIVLALAKDLKEEIEANSGSKVVLTRSKDEALGPNKQVDLEKRAHIANQYAGKNAYFISLHVNDMNLWSQISSGTPSGIFIMYSNKLNPFFSVWEKPFDKLQQVGRPVLEELAKVGFRIQNGTGTKGFKSIGEAGGNDAYILHNIDPRLMPGIYELGFIGNGGEMELLKDSKKVAQAIYRGLAAHKK